MKRILEEPKPKSDTNSVPDTEPETKEKSTQETADDWSLLNTIDIYIIGATLLAQLTKKHRYTIFAVTMTDIEKTLALKKHTDFATKIPVYYHKDLVVFL